MKKKIIFIFALFLTLTGFRGEERIVERSNANIFGRAYASGEKPNINPRLKDTTVPEGGTVEFKVRVYGSPDLKITWYHNDVVIKISDRFDISWDKTTAKLVIKNVTTKEAGTYTLKVTNEFGEDQSSAELTVTAKES